MPYMQRGNAHIYYEDVGRGEPIITTHGVVENADYWSLPGVTQMLRDRYRVISMDMRAHGYTVVDGEPQGFDVDTIADDISALAEHLGLDRFHLLTHATGGMVGMRYAMYQSDRLITHLSTDTGSATIPSVEGIDPGAGSEFTETWAVALESATDEQAAADMRANPFPWLIGIARSPEAERMYGLLERMGKRTNRKAVAPFIRTFFTDPDPHVDLLRAMKCPTLVLLGELDVVFVQPSEISAREIPDVRHVVMKGLGHMTAIEDPEGLVRELYDFLDCVRETGCANR
jgi:pimeloyl-ACP methyl ester carboxylesterase